MPAIWGMWMKADGARAKAEKAVIVTEAEKLKMAKELYEQQIADQRALVAELHAELKESRDHYVHLVRGIEQPLEHIATTLESINNYMKNAN